MARRTVRVNIHNRGKFMGITTPVYNYPMDYETYLFLLDFGLNIEIYHPEYDPRLTAKQKMSETYYEDQAVKSIEKPTQEKIEEPKKEAVDEVKKGEETVAEAQYMKAVYTKEELDTMSKIDLIKILKFRGHVSSRTGKRDSLAPRYDDNKTILKDKVMKSNRI